MNKQSLTQVCPQASPYAMLGSLQQGCQLIDSLGCLFVKIRAPCLCSWLILYSTALSQLLKKSIQPQGRKQKLTVQNDTVENLPDRFLRKHFKKPLTTFQNCSWRQSHQYKLPIVTIVTSAFSTNKKKTICQQHVNLYNRIPGIHVLCWFLTHISANVIM